MENVEHAHTHHWLAAQVTHPIPTFSLITDFDGAKLPVQGFDHAHADVVLVCDGCHGFKTFRADRVSE